jgi:SAM-dependent methyltransferase
LTKAFATSSLKGRLWKHWYRYINRVMDDSPIWFMNYGYIPPGETMISLRPEDEPNRTRLQLYEVVARPADLTGRDVLEVSCGRGGGSRFLNSYRGPRRMVGLDRTERSVAFCTRQHGGNGLRFLCGDALALPFPDESFDAIVNVEASHCYPDFRRFLGEVRRILRPSGHFLYTDARLQSRLDSWRNDLASCGLTMLEREDITAHVVRALEFTNDSVTSLIRESAPRLARPFLTEFAATKGSAVHRWLQSGYLQYVRYVFRKT